MAAWLGLGAVPAVLPPELLRFDPVLGISGRVVIYGVGLALLSALLVGSLSAWHAARDVSADGLRDGRSATGNRGAQRARQALVAAEIALALVLLTGAGLLIRTLVGLSAQSPGFDPRGVLTMRMSLPMEKYRGDAIVTFFGSLEQQVSRLPGVRSAGVASQFPPFGFSSRRLEIEGRSGAGEGALPKADVTIASGGFFSALGTSVVRGRGFQPGDTAEAPRVALVNATFAARFLPGESAIGRRIREVRDGQPTGWVEIVGVVADTRNHGLHQPVEPEVFLSDVQARGAWNQLFLLVRTTGDAAGLFPSIRAVVRELDPDLPVYMVQTLEDAFRESLLRQRLTLTLLGLLAVLAVGLAATGLYGVMSFVVGARTREIGLRMSLGATAGSVRRLVLRQALTVAATGVAVGLAGAMLAGRALAALLVGVGPRDPVTLGAVTVVLVAVALAAAYLPARRASRVDPLEALRVE
jgi:predicted permease